MMKLFFYNREDRPSQMAYKALMLAGVEVKPIEVTGKNIANKLKMIGITHIPTLYLRDQRTVKMLVGEEIIRFLQAQEDPLEESYEEPSYETKKVKPRKEKIIHAKEPSEKSDVSEVISDNEEVQIGSEGSEIGSELEKDNGKIDPKVAMKMMEKQNEALYG